MVALANGKVLLVTYFWQCPNCKLEDTTREERPHTRFHSCPKLAGMSAPMLPRGVKAKITAHEREDYVGTDLVRRDDNGRPIMSVTVEREEGLDCTVFAPTAVARVS